jgi:hypothetical protein
MPNTLNLTFSYHYFLLFIMFLYIPCKFHTSNDRHSILSAFDSVWSILHLTLFPRVFFVPWSECSRVLWISLMRTLTVLSRALVTIFLLITVVIIEWH